eukprot:TRINITY_DN11647_c0_g1_i1.p1 TRINITY_DN11647_c0_g1~~TRINITY_DN11647_c0_g1_i1.p1  ORF type:complete len:1101 (+),score=238.31 TRINITY_DN11647_c0_g1_i1:1-3303(+)
MSHYNQNYYPNGYPDSQPPASSWNPNTPYTDPNYQPYDPNAGYHQNAPNPYGTNPPYGDPNAFNNTNPPYTNSNPPHLNSNPSYNQGTNQHYDAYNSGTSATQYNTNSAYTNNPPYNQPTTGNYGQYDYNGNPTYNTQYETNTPYADPNQAYTNSNTTYDYSGNPTYTNSNPRHVNSNPPHVNSNNNYENPPSGQYHGDQSYMNFSNPNQNTYNPSDGSYQTNTGVTGSYPLNTGSYQPNTGVTGSYPTNTESYQPNNAGVQYTNHPGNQGTRNNYESTSAALAAVGGNASITPNHHLTNSPSVAPASHYVPSSNEPARPRNSSFTRAAEIVNNRLITDNGPNEMFSRVRMDIPPEIMEEKRREQIEWSGQTPLYVSPEFKDIPIEHALAMGQPIYGGDEFMRYSDDPEEPFIQQFLKVDPEEDVLQCGSYGFIYLKYVSKVLYGKSSDVLKSSDADPSLCFSLIYGENSIDFQSKNEHQFEVWTQGIIAYIKKLKAHLTYGEFLGNGWGSDKSLTLNEKSALSLLEDIGVQFRSKSEVFIEKFALVDRSGDGRIGFEEFSEMMQRMRQFDTLKPIFTKYSADGNVLTTQELLQFLHEEQFQETATEDDARIVIDIINNKLNFDGDGLSWWGFMEYILSEDFNSIFNEDSCGFVYQDMTKPLSWYYISTSHNTYCTSDQLKGKSSVEMYARALRENCRCLELDCWDGSAGEPDILHGNTLTSRIKFLDVLKCIKENAFITSKYPVILSIENHCCQDQQRTMARHFVSVFGDMLAAPITSGSELPSPEDLAYKIVLKGPTVTNDIFDDETYLTIMQQEKRKPEKVAQELSSLILLSGVSFKGFDQVSRIPWEMSSFEESKLDKIYKRESGSMVDYNKYQLSRTYPKGSRVDSSNYNPVPFWNLGCHLVALNYQTSSKPMWLNKAFFSDNGNCGYVIKPAILMETDGYSPVDNPRSFERRNPNSDITNVMIEIIGARQLPAPPKKKTKVTKFKKKSSFNPVVRVKMIGIDYDTQERKTTAEKSKQFAPNWNQTFNFDLVMSERAILLIRIDISDKVGQTRVANYSIPVRCIRQGYRTLKLNNYKGKKQKFSDLLCHIRLSYK